MTLTVDTNLTTQPYLDEDGMQWELAGWYEYKGRKRYLMKYTRPGLYGRYTHSLTDGVCMPLELLDGFQHPESLNIVHPVNQAGPQIQLHKITRVLDMAWYRDWEQESDSTLDNPSEPQEREDGDYGQRPIFDDFFVQLQWRDHNDEMHITWEYAETLMSIMENNHCLSLLAQWAWQVDYRHEQLLSNCPIREIQPILGKPGWQYS